MCRSTRPTDCLQTACKEWHRRPDARMRQAGLPYSRIRVHIISPCKLLVFWLVSGQLSYLLTLVHERCKCHSISLLSISDVLYHYSTHILPTTSVSHHPIVSDSTVSRSDGKPPNVHYILPCDRVLVYHAVKA